LVRFDPDQHTGEESAPVPGSDEDEVVEVLSDLQSEQVAEFALESQLELFLVSNWAAINWGRSLQIWKDPHGVSGHQYQTPVGRPDFVCIDPSTNALVIVELKRGRLSDKVVGQVARYMGWVRVHLAQTGQEVQGLIVAHETDDQLAYAVSALPGLTLMTYAVKFELKSETGPAGQLPGAAAPRD
jgi:RecB family endonuclease NucS